MKWSFHGSDHINGYISFVEVKFHYRTRNRIFPIIRFHLISTINRRRWSKLDQKIEDFGIKPHWRINICTLRKINNIWANAEYPNRISTLCCQNTTHVIWADIKTPFIGWLLLTIGSMLPIGPWLYTCLSWRTSVLFVYVESAPSRVFCK